MEVSGSSQKGDLNEALFIAIESAKKILLTEHIDWSLVSLEGENGGFILVNVITVTIDARVRDSASGPKSVCFQMVDHPRDKRPFIVSLSGENIDHARRILSGEEKRVIHLQGRIVKSTAEYNPDWAFHLDPSSIEFFEYAIEVCDANMGFVEDNLDDVGGSTLPNCHWCPWNSEIVAELPYK